MSRPPIGAVWGSVQTAAARSATDSLIPGRALVLSPHPDDETIGCGLLMAEKAKRGIPIAVAVATDGRSGWFSQTPRPTPQEIADIRRHEWHRALDVLSLPQTDRFEFNFPDGELIHREQELLIRLGELLRTLRPSQVFVTRLGDPHPDHRTLARAVQNAVAEVYRTELDAVHSEAPPRIFSYRVYPGEGFWRGGRPGHVTVGAALGQLVRSTFGLAGHRALLIRAPASLPSKVAAISAYDSQSRLLGGELRYVWGKSVELFWPADRHGSEDSAPNGHST